MHTWLLRRQPTDALDASAVFRHSSVPDFALPSTSQPLPPSIPCLGIPQAGSDAPASTGSAFQNIEALPSMAGRPSSSVSGFLQASIARMSSNGAKLLPSGSSAARLPPMNMNSMDGRPSYAPSESSRAGPSSTLSGVGREGLTAAAREKSSRIVWWAE